LEAKNLTITEPLSYKAFMNLVMGSRFLITDSGGVQEETTYLGIPCLTLRPNTERPVTVTQGSNRLCTPEDIPTMLDAIASGQLTGTTRPDLWDGKTSTRVADSIERRMTPSGCP
jgi:UDP-N-acetylglucosamine 2-epimerase (non-hydrolysing)